MIRVEIDGIDVSSDMIESPDEDLYLREGLLFGDMDAPFIPDSVELQLDNSAGRYDPDNPSGSFGSGNNMYGKILSIFNGNDLTWAGWVESIIANDQTGLAEIRALTFVAKLTGKKFIWTYSGDPSGAILELIQTKCELPATFIDAGSFAAETYYDTLVGLTAEINIIEGSEVDAVDLLTILCDLFGKKIYVHKNYIFITHVAPWNRNEGIELSQPYFLANEIRKYRDAQRVVNTAVIPYKSGSNLVWITLDQTDIGVSPSEYAQSINRYGERRWPMSTPYLLNSDNTIALAHGSLTSATVAAQDILDTYQDAPLIVEAAVDLIPQANRDKWASLHYFGIVSATLETQHVSYSGEPFEIEIKRGNRTKGTLTMRAVNKFPQRQTDSANYITSRFLYPGSYNGTYYIRTPITALAGEFLMASGTEFNFY